MPARMRIELLDVTCRDTEDILVPDTFYLMSVLATADHLISVVITDPLSIKTGQTLLFPAQDRLLFDGILDGEDVLLGGLRAFEEDFAKEWDKKAVWRREIMFGLPTFGILPSDRAEAAAVVLTAATTVLELQAHSDRDDTLGTLILVIPKAGEAIEERTWTLKEEGIGFSTWDYTVRYQITRTPC